MTNQSKIELSPKPSDEIRKTTCYMCACRCGINVHLKDGKVAYIEGNRDHPVNKGVLCAKGSSGIMQVNAPSRLRAPLKRVGERGSGAFEEISWEEALSLAVSWLKPLRETAPEKLAFFTGRDQSQSFTSFWAQNFGTPNYAAHGGFCSVNMATAGIYTMGGAFWEFGQPDWERTKLFVLFGVAEDHDSNPIKMGIGKLKARGGTMVGVNPIRTGYNAVADEWIGIRPGTDGLFILSLIYELFRLGKIDIDYLARYTNAPFLVNDDKTHEDFGLFLRDEAGEALVFDTKSNALVPFSQKGILPKLNVETEVEGVPYKTVFHTMVHHHMNPEYAPERVAPQCDISVAHIKNLAAKLAETAFDEAFTLPLSWTDFRGETHSEMTGRPVSFHAMRGISAHANGFQTCRALHILQILLGSVEVPGGFRFKPPYPKPSWSHPKPHADATPNSPLNGPHLGFVHGPEDLCLTDEGRAKRIDKAFTWENPLSAHGLMHTVIRNAYEGDPYKIDTLFMYMANMAWNSSMNTEETIAMLTAKEEDGSYKIPHILYSDAYSSEMVAYADLILPDTTYLERHDCISLLDRPICEADRAADAIRWPVIEPDRDVRCFQSVLVDLANRMALPGFVEDGVAKYKDYADYIANHERRPSVGPLMGFRGEDGDKVGRGASNPAQIERYIENGAFFEAHIPENAQFYKPWNEAYQEWSVEIGLVDKTSPYVFQLYLEPLRKFQRAAEGKGAHQPPEELRARIKDTMSPLPIWYPAVEEAFDGNTDYPIHALTQRPMAMYHSWGSQNAWLRQLHGKNFLYVPRAIWDEHGFEEGDWAELSSRNGKIEVPVALMEALNASTVWTWNAIGKRKKAWALSEDASEANIGFLLNHLIDDKEAGQSGRSNSDPITGQAAWFDLKVQIRKIEPRAVSAPQFPALNLPNAKTGVST